MIIWYIYCRDSILSESLCYMKAACAVSIIIETAYKLSESSSCIETAYRQNQYAVQYEGSMHCQNHHRQHTLVESPCYIYVLCNILYIVGMMNTLYGDSIHCQNHHAVLYNVSLFTHLLSLLWRYYRMYVNRRARYSTDYQLNLPKCISNY